MDAMLAGRLLEPDDNLQIERVSHCHERLQLLEITESRVECLVVGRIRASTSQPAKAEAVVTPAQKTFAGSPAMRPTGCCGSSTPVPRTSSAGKNDPQ